MAEAQSKRNRPPGQTRGTDERPPQQLATPILTFDLSHDVGQLLGTSLDTRGRRKICHAFDH